MSCSTPDSLTLANHRAEMARHLRRNYTLHALEGGVFMGGVAFVQPQAVMPKMVESLGGANWMIALVPLLMQMAMVLPQPFVLQHVERRAFVKRYIVVVGLGQRLSFLATGLLLLLVGDAFPAIALAAVMLMPLALGLTTGALAAAWQDYVAKTVPENRRSSLWGLRQLIGTLIGLGAASGISLVLMAFPGATGYGILFLAAFACTMVSYLLFMWTRETTLPPQNPGEPLKPLRFFRSIPQILRNDGRLARYLAARILGAGCFIIIPFLSIYMLKLLGREEQFLGVLVNAQILGTFAGTFAGAYLGDRFGGKSVLMLSLLAFVAVSLAAPFVQSEWQALALFFVFGGALNLRMIGTPILDMEMAPPAQRIRYLTLTAMLGLPGLLLAWGAAWLIRDHTTSLMALAIPAAATSLAAAVLLLGVAEPRRHPPR